MRPTTLFRSSRPILAAAALVAATVLGPPRITVREATATPITPGAVLDIATQHHTDETAPEVSGRAIAERGGERITQPLVLTAAASKGRYGVTKQWAEGTAWVLVFTIKQGDHGEHGTAESIVKVSAAGRILGIDNLVGQNERGDRYPRAASEQDLAAALVAVRGN